MAPKEEKKKDDKKAKAGKEEKPKDAKKAAPAKDAKKDDKKAAPAKDAKKDDKKAAPAKDAKKDDKKAAPAKDDKKAAPAKDAKAAAPAAAKAAAAPAAAKAAAAPAAAKAAAPAAAPAKAAGPPVLPAGWTTHVDPNSSHTYYYNAAAKVSQWTFPTAVFVPNGLSPSLLGPTGQPLTGTELAHAKHAADVQRRFQLQAMSTSKAHSGTGSLSGYSVAADMATTDNGWNGGPSKHRGDGGQTAVAGGYWWYL